MTAALLGLLVAASTLPERFVADRSARGVQPLQPRDLLVLAVLAEGELHGYGLIKAVEGRSDGAVSLDPANLYRLLRRMRGAGWIVERQGDPTEGEDPRRRVYQISPIGRRLLAAEVQRLERLVRQVRPALARGGEGS